MTIRDWLAAPRRLRELGRAYDRARDRHYARMRELKEELGRFKQRALRAECQLKWIQDKIKRAEETEKENERLRALNGKTYRDYVEALEQRDRAFKQLNRR
jgi:hypothetical protein